MTLRPGDIDLTDPDVFVAHGGPPHEYLTLLRNEAPVFWHEPPRQQKTISPIRQGFFVLTKRADLVDVSRSPKLFSSEVGTPFLWDAEPEVLPGIQAMLIGMDPPHHVRYRRLVQPGFTPRMVKQLEPVIRGHARSIVERVAAKGGACDFVQDLACELPLTLICELVGIPQQDRRQIFDWSNRMIGADDPDMAEGTVAGDASAQMWLYCQKLVAEKRERPDDTLLSKYVHGEVDGHRISDMEINHFFVLLAVAGNETTRNATSHFMRLMFEHPDQYELLKSDVDRYLPGAIEEALRYSPPVMNFRRTASQDTEIRGVEIRAGAKLCLSYPAANRDEEVFEDPQTFDITREKNDHVAFGIGEHYCMGANLARMQLHAILYEVLTRLPSMTLAEQPRIQRSNFIHGIKEMRVRF